MPFRLSNAAIQSVASSNRWLMRERSASTRIASVLWLHGLGTRLSSPRCMNSRKLALIPAYSCRFAGREFLKHRSKSASRQPFMSAMKKATGSSLSIQFTKLPSS